MDPTIRQWWREERGRRGFLSTARRFAAALWEFLRESTPASRRQRYGDTEFDWDYRVDTTSATVSWRDRLLGELHSPYQPTDPVLFDEMMASVVAASGDGLSEFTFIDLGSGKGRALLMAADYPFRRIVGVELLPALYRIARENIRGYASASQKCIAIECICGDAGDFVFPPEPIVLYLFNPMAEIRMRRVIANLERSLRQKPRQVSVVYHNPEHEPVFGGFRRVVGTHRFSLSCCDGR